MEEITSQIYKVVVLVFWLRPCIPPMNKKNNGGHILKSSQWRFAGGAIVGGTEMVECMCWERTESTDYDSFVCPVAHDSIN